ncbi:hypothetical protein QDT91_29055 (plasmid) [Mycolicibacterium aubagnense]|uniref:hypothetical protein n=1 Tax=Mycolicibacterium aubagnense TaxID=319707 RepID=UPI00244E534C|nr:hypothetical protein [Mycolicibacterium aubagnense]WGI36051.1 hypothetical protein QDT91_29055 [Mycolicibacterium aubagnense]
MPIGHQLHLLSSTIVVVAAIVSLFAFVLADLRERAAALVRRVGLFMLAALIGASVGTGVAVAIDSADGAGEVWIAQRAERAELAAVAGWLTYVALRTVRARMGTNA